MKKNNRLWLLLFVSCSVLVSLNSCKKDNPKLTIVKGEIRNEITGESAANIPINIFECELGFYFGADRCSTFKTLYTDLNGNFNYSFNSKMGNFYKIGLGLNDKFPTEYRLNITSNKENIINFSVKPLKVLQLKVKVLRHDKNWLNINGSNRTNDNYWSYDFYNGINPSISLDTTYNIKIQAGRSYVLFAGLSNKTADNTYENNEIITKLITIENADTTSVEFVVQ